MTCAAQQSNTESSDMQSWSADLLFTCDQSADSVIVPQVGSKNSHTHYYYYYYYYYYYKCQDLSDAIAVTEFLD